MVQLFYYENRGKNFKKLMSYEGLPFKVNLYPHEELGSMLTSYWIIKIPWWRKTSAKILEVCGGHYRYASARVTDLGGGMIMIKGKFKSQTGEKTKIKDLLKYAVSPSKEEKLSSLPTQQSLMASCSGGKQATETVPEEFQLYLSTNVTNEDFQQGYSMTGKLEQGSKHSESLTLTHFAVVKRKGY